MLFHPFANPLLTCVTESVCHCINKFELLRIGAYFRRGIIETFEILSGLTRLQAQGMFVRSTERCTNGNGIKLDGIKQVGGGGQLQNAMELLNTQCGVKNRREEGSEITR